MVRRSTSKIKALKKKKKNDLHSVVGIPHTNGLVIRAGHDELSIRGETHRLNDAVVGAVVTLHLLYLRVC